MKVGSSKVPQDTEVGMPKVVSKVDEAYGSKPLSTNEFVKWVRDANDELKRLKEESILLERKKCEYENELVRVDNSMSKVRNKISYLKQILGPYNDDPWRSLK